jgi:hypothetical protein
MAPQEVHLELLLSKRVRDVHDQPVGRIEEVHTVQQGHEVVVLEYVLGPFGLLERLSAWLLQLSIWRLLGGSRQWMGYKVPWDKMDLSDPERPRLRCAKGALERLSISREDRSDTPSRQ